MTRLAGSIGGLALAISAAMADEPRVGMARKVEIIGDLKGSSFRIEVRASGEFPSQRLDQVNLWIDETRVKIPREAYAEVWNPNPVSVELRESGTKTDLLPDDVRGPIVALVFGRYDREWAAIVLLEERVPVVALTRGRGGIHHECQVFDRRFAAVCDSMSAEALPWEGSASEP